MKKIVVIRYRNKDKTFYFDSSGLELKKGDRIIIKDGKKVSHAIVSAHPTASHPLLSSLTSLPLNNIIRKATTEDEIRIKENIKAESGAYSYCVKRIHERQLSMKLIDVEALFDENKLLFYFTSNKKVDFRELIKDMSYKFKQRIEMVQIGVRNKSRILNGYGACGYPLCCSSFLTEFKPITIKMARELEMPLNPFKISGLCGKLMCCIAFEKDSNNSCNHARCKSKKKGYGK
ncbi:MAG: stage 0 sporulation family protein [Nitrospirota bacterium]